MSQKREDLVKQIRDKEKECEKIKEDCKKFYGEGPLTVWNGPGHKKKEIEETRKKEKECDEVLAELRMQLRKIPKD